MAKLVLKFNAGVLKEYEMDKPSMAVGRSNDNDIVVDNPVVSSHHCKILRVGDDFFVEDLESTNGTFLNEKRIVKANLKDNDVVGLATKHTITFLEEKPSAPPIEPTMVLPSPQSKPDSDTAPIQAEAPASASVPSPAPKAASSPEDKVGIIEIVKGAVDKQSYELTALSTYIGKSDRVQVQIAGGSFFSPAPEVAASIHRKPNGYLLVAVKDGYPVLNGSRVSGQVMLNDGDIIECGATTMHFSFKKTEEEKEKEEASDQPR